MQKELLKEKYILGTLTESERIVFNNLLETDATFKKEVSFEDNIAKVAEANHDKEFKELISSFEEEILQSTTPKEGKSIYRWLAVAASVIVVFGLSYTFWSQQSNADLFKENFIPYRNVTHTIVRSENGITDAKSKAFSAYELGNYETALNQFANLYNNKGKESYYLFYQANALLQLNRAEKAIPLLKKHLESGDSLSTKTNWFLAMAYLQIDDTNSAIKALRSVVQKTGFKQKEAERLLEKLQ